MVPPSAWLEGQSAAWVQPPPTELPQPLAARTPPTSKAIEQVSALSSVRIRFLLSAGTQQRARHQNSRRYHRNFSAQPGLHDTSVTGFAELAASDWIRAREGRCALADVDAARGLGASRV